MVFNRRGFGDQPDTQVRLSVREFASGDGRTHRYVSLSVGEKGQRSEAHITIRTSELGEAIRFLDVAQRVD
jgi:hypothetical protein